MRLTLALIVASLSWTACSAVDDIRPIAIEPGKPFSLAVDGTAQLAGESLLVGFDGVAADSRCRKGEQCVTAGDAVVRVWWRRGSAAKESGELHTAARTPQGVSIGSFELRLAGLAPEGVAGRSIDPKAYVATLVLNAGAATQAAR